MYSVFAAFSFCIGACVASFLNVVIWRVPRGESIVSPPSHCPSCGAPVRWWRNIPVLSWLALRGRCADCKAAISPRYVIVETLGACLFLAAFLNTVPPGAPVSPWTLLELLVVWTWLSLMIAGSFIDMDHLLLPDFVTAGGMALGVLNALAVSARSASFGPALASLAGLACGFGLMWLVRFLGSKAFGREAMGSGDVWLTGAVGAISGPAGAVAVIILSSFAGSLYGLAMMIAGKTRFGRYAEIPYGPFICLAHAVWLFCGDGLWRWYAGLLGFEV